MLLHGARDGYAVAAHESSHAVAVENEAAPRPAFRVGEHGIGAARSVELPSAHSHDAGHRHDLALVGRRCGTPLHVGAGQPSAGGAGVRRYGSGLVAPAHEALGVPGPQGVIVGFAPGEAGVGEDRVGSRRVGCHDDGSGLISGYAGLGRSVEPVFLEVGVRASGPSRSNGIHCCRGVGLQSRRGGIRTRSAGALLVVSARDRHKRCRSKEKQLYTTSSPHVQTSIRASKLPFSETDHYNWIDRRPTRAGGVLESRREPRQHRPAELVARHGDIHPVDAR